MKSVLITGALGFTGRYLSDRLKQSGYFVHRLGSVEQSPSDGSADQYYQIDIRNFAALRSLLAKTRPDAIVHLAGIAFVGHDDVGEIYASNVVATRHLLQAAVDVELKTNAIILASSANVYGNSTGGALDESTAINPANDYAVSKASMELVAGLYRNVLPIIITRPFNYTGLGQDPRFIIPKIVDHARRRAPVIELGNLDVSRDFSDVRFVADIYARLLQTPAAVGRTINLCSGQDFSLREIIEKVERISGHKMDIQVNPLFVRPNEVRMMRGDARLLRGLVGTVETPSIDDTLSWMLEG